MAVQESSQPPPASPAHPGPSAEAVRQQLAKLLASPQLVNSPNLCNFLQYVVEKTLAGEAATIKGYTVATQVLGTLYLTASIIFRQPISWPRFLRRGCPPF